MEAGGILGLGTHDKMAGIGLNGPLNEIHRIFRSREDCQGARGGSETKVGGKVDIL